MTGSMNWIRSGLIALIDLRHCFSQNLLTSQSRPFRLPKLHRPTPHQLVLSSLPLHSSDRQPTNQPAQICHVLASQPHRDSLPANRPLLSNRNALLLQTYLVPTTILQRSSLLASRFMFNPIPAYLQVCLAPVFLLYIRLPAN